MFGSGVLVKRLALAPLLVIVFLIPIASGLRAQVSSPLSVPVNLARMVDESEKIVLARVTGVRAEPHPQFQNLNTVVVTLEIIEPLKGVSAKDFTFRQFVIGPAQR